MRYHDEQSHRTGIKWQQGMWCGQMRIAQERAKQMRGLTLAFHRLARCSAVRDRPCKLAEDYCEGHVMMLPCRQRLTILLRGFRQVLRKAGLGDANLAQLAEWHLQLQAAFERMANIKEYRRELSGLTIQHPQILPVHASAQETATLRMYSDK